MIVAIVDELADAVARVIDFPYENNEKTIMQDFKNAIKKAEIKEYDIDDVLDNISLYYTERDYFSITI